MPMPIDLTVTYEDGSSENFYIPLQMMRSDKPNPNPSEKRTVLNDWAWANPDYNFSFKTNKKIKNVEIDPSKLMADIKPDNNVFEVK